MELLIWILRGIGILMLPFAFYFLLWLVKHAASKNFIWTIVKEGTCKAVMTADGAAFRKFRLQFRGYNFKGNQEENIEGVDEWDIVDYNEKTAKRRGGLIDTLKDKFGLRGIKILGLPGFFSVYVYSFRGLSVTQSKEGIIKFERKDETTDYIDLRDMVIRAIVAEAEDKDYIPLTIVLALRFRIINPYKTLFHTESSEWLDMMLNMVLPVFRKHVGKEAWKVIQMDIEEKSKEGATETNGAKKSSFIQNFMDELGEKRTKTDQETQDETDESIEDTLSGRYGLELKTSKILNIDPEGEVAGDIRKASIKKFAADREIERMEKEYGKVREFGALGEMIRRLEALERVGASGKLIISAPELSEIAKGIGKLGFGKETSSLLTEKLTAKSPDDIKKLAERLSGKSVDEIKQEIEKFLS